MSIKQTIDISPISVNMCYRGRRFATKEFKEWQKMGLLLMGKKETIVGDVSVHIDFFVKHPKMKDLDNLIKSAIDLTVKKKWIKDDRQIQYLSVCKKQSNREKIEIKVEII